MTFPRYATPIRGRDDDLETLSGMLVDVGLTTLWGPGGVGKTRLASEISLRARRAGRPQWFVSVREDSDFAELVASVLTALQIPDSFARSAPGAQRIDQWLALQDGPLLVLDEVEVAIDAVRELVDVLVETDTELHVLATSRMPLELAGEQLLQLRLLENGPAGELFRDAAPRDHPLDSEAVTQAVEQLEGLPLAIELAAARLEVLPMHELVQRLRDPLPVLRNPSTTGRHAGVWRSFEASWDDLPVWARSVLAQLNLFAHDISLTAAEAVVRMPSHEARTVLDALHLLTRRCLLRPVEGSPDLPASPRYRLGPFVRDYVTQRAPPPSSERLARHASWFGEHALAALYAWHRGVASSHWLREQEHELALALRRCIDGTVTGWATLARCGAALVFTMDGTRSLRDRLEILDSVFEALEQHREGPDDPRALGKLHEARATLYSRLGDVQASLAAVNEALDVARSTQDAELEAGLLGVLGNRLFELGQDEAGLDAYRLSLERAEQATHPRAEVNALVAITLAEDWENAWRPERSLPLLRRAVAHAPPADRQVETNARYRLGQLLICLGQPSEAIDELEGARRIAMAADLPWFETCAHLATGQAQLHLGDVEQAMAAFMCAHSTAMSCSADDLAADAALHLAMVELQHGHLDDATRWMSEADDRLQAGPEHWQPHRLLATVMGSIVHAVAGRTELANEALARAQSLAQAVQEPAYAGVTVFGEVAHTLIGLHARIAAGEDEVGHAGWREALTRFDAVEPRYVLFLRVVRPWLGDLAAACEEALQAWEYGPEGSFFSAPSSAPVPTHKYRAVSRILDALVSARIEDPGRTVSPEELIARGWPDEHLTKRSARNRLHVALNTLRKLGVDPLQRIDGCYRLDPTVPARRRG